MIFLNFLPSFTLMYSLLWKSASAKAALKAVGTEMYIQSNVLKGQSTFHPITVITFEKYLLHIDMPHMCNNITETFSNFSNVTENVQLTYKN